MRKYFKLNRAPPYKVEFREGESLSEAIEDTKKELENKKMENIKNSLLSVRRVGSVATKKTEKTENQKNNSLDDGINWNEVREAGPKSEIRQYDRNVITESEFSNLVNSNYRVFNVANPNITAIPTLIIAPPAAGKSFLVKHRPDLHLTDVDSLINWNGIDWRTPEGQRALKIRYLSIINNLKGGDILIGTFPLEGEILDAITQFSSRGRLISWKSTIEKLGLQAHKEKFKPNLQDSLRYRNEMKVLVDISTVVEDLLESNLLTNSHGYRELVRDRVSRNTLEARLGKSIPFNYMSKRVKQWVFDVDTVWGSNVALFILSKNSEFREKVLFDEMGIDDLGLGGFISRAKELSTQIIGSGSDKYFEFLNLECLAGFLTMAQAEMIDFDPLKATEDLVSSDIKLLSLKDGAWTHDNFLSDMEEIIMNKCGEFSKPVLSFEDFLNEPSLFKTTGSAKGLKISDQRVNRNIVIRTKQFYDYMSTKPYGTGIDAGSAVKMEKAKLRMIVSFPLGVSVRDAYLAYYIEQLLSGIPEIKNRGGFKQDIMIQNNLINMAVDHFAILSYDWKGFENHHSKEILITMLSSFKRLCETRLLTAGAPYDIVKELNALFDTCIYDYNNLTVSWQGVKFKHTGGEASGSRFTALFNNLLNYCAHEVRNLCATRIGLKLSKTVYRMSQGDDAVEVYEGGLKEGAIRLRIMEMMGNVTNKRKTTNMVGKCSFLKKYYFSDGKLVMSVCRSMSSIVQHNPLSRTAEANVRSKDILERFSLANQTEKSKYLYQIMLADLQSVGFIEEAYIPTVLGGCGLVGPWRGSSINWVVTEEPKRDVTIRKFAPQDVILPHKAAKLVSAYPEVEDIIRRSEVDIIDKATGAERTNKVYKKVVNQGPKVNTSFKVEIENVEKPALFGCLRPITEQINLARKCLRGREFWSYVLVESQNIFLRDNVESALKRFGKGFGLDYLLGDVQSPSREIGDVTNEQLKLWAMGRVKKTRKISARMSAALNYYKLLPHIDIFRDFVSI